jgi:hypothetical protein
MRNSMRNSRSCSVIIRTPSNGSQPCPAWVWIPRNSHHGSRANRGDIRDGEAARLVGRRLSRPR